METVDKTILSWDVGVHNLAYCILSYNKEAYRFPILKWEVIDLLDTSDGGENDDKCTYLMKNGDVCGKKAMFKSSNMMFCTRHSKVKDVVSNKEIGEIVAIKQPTKKEIQEKGSLINLGKSMFKKLDERPFMLDVSTVIIENQPCMKNPKMKSVQMMLFSYFVLKGVMPIESHIDHIQLIAARNKLKVYKGPEIKSDKKTVYARTKDLGIKYCTSMIDDDPENSEFLKTHKKKDDLCDAYLQGAFYFVNMIDPVISKKDKAKIKVDAKK